jgi:hypothetical protein
MPDLEMKLSSYNTMIIISAVLSHVLEDERLISETLCPDWKKKALAPVLLSAKYNKISKPTVYI